jgi:hypothetical protein
MTFVWNLLKCNTCIERVSYYKRNPQVSSYYISHYYDEDFYLLGHNAMQFVKSQPSSCYLLSRLAFSSTLKMEVNYSSVTLVDFQWTTLRYIPEDTTLHNHRCENLKYYIFFWHLSLHAILISITKSFRRSDVSMTGPTCVKLRRRQEGRIQFSKILH